MRLKQENCLKSADQPAQISHFWIYVIEFLATLLDFEDIKDCPAAVSLLAILYYPIFIYRLIMNNDLKNKVFKRKKCSYLDNFLTKWPYIL